MKHSTLIIVFRKGYPVELAGEYRLHGDAAKTFDHYVRTGEPKAISIYCDGEPVAVLATDAIAAMVIRLDSIKGVG